MVSASFFCIGAAVSDTEKQLLKHIEWILLFSIELKVNFWNITEY